MIFCYRPLSDIPMCEVFDGRLAKFQVTQPTLLQKPPKYDGALCDGEDTILVQGSDDGLVELFIQHVPSRTADHILGVLAHAFDTEIISEYDPRFFDRGSQEEADAALKRSKELQDAEFYSNLQRWLAGESSSIDRSPFETALASIATQLIAKDPTLATPACKSALLAEIRRIYADQRVRVTTTEAYISILTSISASSSHETQPKDKCGPDRGQAGRRAHRSAELGFRGAAR